jgi:hypothetical protein
LAEGVPLFCARCHGRIQRWQKWHLDHRDGSNVSYLGVSHPECNLATVTHARERAERAEAALRKLREREAS